MKTQAIAPERVSDHCRLHVSALEDKIEYHVLAMKRDIENQITGRRGERITELYKIESACLSILSAASRIRAYDDLNHSLGAV